MKIQNYPNVGWQPTESQHNEGDGKRQLEKMPWWLLDAMQWEQSQWGATKENRIQSDESCDVLIVGGGFTGLWTALHLHAKSPKLKIIIAEGSVCGYGASGRNGGLVAGYWRYMSELVRLYGQQRATELALLGGEAQDAIRDVIAQSGLDLWWREGGHIKVSKKKNKAMADIVVSLAEVGHPEQVSQISPEDLPRLTGSSAFDNGLLFKEGATVHPGRLVRLLRHLAISKGIVIYEHTPVSDVATSGPLRCKTATGAVITARQVVLATNAALCSTYPISKHVMPFSSHVVLTEPIGQALNDSGFANGVGVFDTAMFSHYFRVTPDRRILMGNGSGSVGRFGKVAAPMFLDDVVFDRAISVLDDFYGQTQARATYAWGGPIDVSADKLPFAGRLPKSEIYFCAGYTAHGVNPSWIMGNILSSLLCHQQDKWTTSLLAKRKWRTFPPEPFRSFAARPIQNAIIRLEESQRLGLPCSIYDRALEFLPRLAGISLGRR